MDSIFNDFILSSWVDKGIMTRAVKVVSHTVAAVVVGGAIAAAPAVASNLDPQAALPALDEVGLSQLQMQVDSHPALKAGHLLRGSILLNIDRLRTGEDSEFDAEMLAFAEDALATFNNKK